MIENRKAIAPIPAVGAAGEQSHGSKTTNIITEKSRTNNLNTGNLKTLSMTELYDTTYPPKAAIIDGLLYVGAYLFVGAPKIGKSFFMAQLATMSQRELLCGSMTCIRARCCISPLRMTTPASRNACTRCSVQRIRRTCTLQRSP